ncbi:hypothetical protein Rifp1Sym_ee00050 [endosymbiont of Riftia pachyptila (vent Ph05)]|uniref:Uncharacterized protein n=1 Tax=endosymbiont of Riftia pachyptila (vent Ph05) TaxID=1048808 RepID=G2DH19_9GAMM|nr:hypothetical protein Rifp1Sym_ee00050 [endosymbiont of Riftia pachyptila (vent Ph05)]
MAGGVGLVLLGWSVALSGLLLPMRLVGFTRLLLVSLLRLPVDSGWLSWLELIGGSSARGGERGVAQRIILERFGQRGGKGSNLVANQRLLQVVPVACGYLQANHQHRDEYQPEMAMLAIAPAALHQLLQALWIEWFGGLLFFGRRLISWPGFGGLDLLVLFRLDVDLWRLGQYQLIAAMVEPIGKGVSKVVFGGSGWRELSLLGGL